MFQDRQFLRLRREIIIPRLTYVSKFVRRWIKRWMIFLAGGIVLVQYRSFFAKYDQNGARFDELIFDKQNRFMIFL